VARALLVGCGCRGRQLGIRLLDAGWQVRGTTRRPGKAAEIERAGIEAALADPDRIATVLDHLADVAVVGWLLGSASGEASELAALHGPRLERLCEEVVDTPVRGIVYEAAGSVPRERLREGRRVLDDAAERWQIPVEIVDHDPDDWSGWTAAAAGAFGSLIRT
jgi:nucleoside-diphosphate-sugar epimerase